jgi:hypothetical protein
MEYKMRIAEQITLMIAAFFVGWLLCVSAGIVKLTIDNLVLNGVILTTFIYIYCRKVHGL